MSLIRNVSSNWGAFAVSVAVSFFLTPFIINRLGDTGYGMWVLLGSIAGYMGLLDLGVRSAIMRYVAKYHVLGDLGQSRSIVSTGVVIFSCLGLVVIVLAIGLALYVVPRFDIPIDRLGESRVALVVMGVVVAVAMVGGVFGGVLSALQRFDVSSLIDVAVSLVTAVLVVSVLLHTTNLVAVAAVSVVVAIGRSIGQFVAARSCYPGLTISVGMSSRQWVKTIYSFGLFSSLIYMSRAIIFSTDALVLGANLPVALITVFAIGASLTDYARSVINGMATVVSPQASAFQAERREAELTSFTVFYAKLATVIILPIATTFYFRGSTFISLWIGDRLAAASGEVLGILTVGLVFWAAHQVMGLTLIGLNRHRALAVAYLFEGLTNLGLSIVLVRSLGVIGVAWGTLIPGVITSVLVVPRLLCNALPVFLPDLLKEAWGRPLLAGLPFVLASILVERYWPARNLLIYFAQVAACIPVAAGSAWVFALNDAERRRIAHAVLRRWTGAGLSDA